MLVNSNRPHASHSSDFEITCTVCYRLSEKSLVLSIQHPPDEGLFTKSITHVARSAASWPNIFYLEIHEVELWQVYVCYSMNCTPLGPITITNQLSVTQSVSSCTSAALPDFGLSVKELPLLLADNLRDALVDSFLSNSVPSCSLSLDMCDILRIKFTAAVDSKNPKKDRSQALTIDEFTKSL